MNVRFLFRCLKARFRDQKFELKALANHLDSHHLALDIGANKGSYLLAMSRAVRAGEVVAFEPQPLLADYLREVVRSCRLANVRIEQVGVSKASGMMDLNVPGTSETSPSASLEKSCSSVGQCHSFRVPVTTLDDFLASSLEQVGAIKIDVEGHEISVLQGAEKTINQHRPLIICESESRHLSSGDVNQSIEYFRRISYGGYFVHPKRGLLELEGFDPDIHQCQQGERFWDKKDYCNNFVLSPN